MKRKHILIVLLILLAVLIVAGIAAGVAASVYLSYYLPRVMDAQEKRINIVRYIGLCQTDAFYDEIMSLPDGYCIFKKGLHRFTQVFSPQNSQYAGLPKSRENRCALRVCA